MSNGKNHSLNCTCGFCRSARRAKAGTIRRRSHACTVVSHTSVLRAPVIGDLDRKPTPSELFNRASIAAVDAWQAGQITYEEKEERQQAAWEQFQRGAGVPA